MAKSLFEQVRGTYHKENSSLTAGCKNSVVFLVGELLRMMFA